VRILGLVSRTHDSGLALVVNGIPILVLEEERFNREKHTRKFPFGSLKAAFDDRGFDLSSVDLITTPWHMRSLWRMMFCAVRDGFPASLNLVPPSARPTQSTLIVSLPNGLRWGLLWHFGATTRMPKIVQVRHHDAHAAIFFVSPFEEATVLVMDGYGDQTAQSVYTGAGNRLECVARNHIFDSLGMLYTAATQHLGFNYFEEGTVMALAATGHKTYASKFRELIRFAPDGEFSVDRDYINYQSHGLNQPFKKKFVEIFGPPRDAGEPISDRHRDLAYALQHTVEETILHVVRSLAKKYKSRNLCLTGGVALNCVANARVLSETDYHSVWVPPCASDSGAPLGSALWHYHQTVGRPREFQLTHAFHGVSYDEADIAQVLRNANLTHERMTRSTLVRQVARDLAAGKIVGWFQGRSELGPRALGHRSILADPRDVTMKDRLNTRVKQRAPFRPFAPAILEERMAEFFDIEQADPFMTMAPKVRAGKKHLIAAAVHFDGTARLQTVSRSTNPLLYAVIEEFAKFTGVPVILNTSFNLREPIVETPEDAIACYLKTRLDSLVIGDFYSTRNSQRLGLASIECASI
jgi:carbamoyltransferase